MKAISTIALIIAFIALLIGGYTQFIQVTELQKEQKKITEDILSLKQGIAKSWQHDGESQKTEWPKYHSATGVLKQLVGNRVIIAQDEIPGFMRAMIMSYDLENPEQIKNLKEGDKVKLKLKETETNLTVVEVEKE